MFVYSKASHWMLRLLQPFVCIVALQSDLVIISYGNTSVHIIVIVIE